MPEYRGIEYRLIPPPIPSARWKWIVQLDDLTLKSGESFLKVSAEKNAKRAIENAIRARGKLSAE